MFCSFCQGSNFDKNTCAVTKDSENPLFVLAFGTKTTFSEVAISGRSKTEETEMPCKKPLVFIFRIISEDRHRLLHEKQTVLFTQKPSFTKVKI